MDACRMSVCLNVCVRVFDLVSAVRLKRSDGRSYWSLGLRSRPRIAFYRRGTTNRVAVAVCVVIGFAPLAATATDFDVVFFSTTVVH